MYIVKSLLDYSKTPFEAQIAQYICKKLDATTCVEKITNKTFIIKALQPVNDFCIYTTATAGSNVNRVNY